MDYLGYVKHVASVSSVSEVSHQWELLILTDAEGKGHSGSPSLPGDRFTPAFSILVFYLICKMWLWNNLFDHL